MAFEDIFLDYFIRFDRLLSIERLSIILTSLSGLLAIFGDTWVDKKVTKLGKGLILVLIIGTSLQVANLYMDKIVAKKVNEMSSNVVFSQLNLVKEKINRIIQDDTVDIKELKGFKIVHNNIRNDLQHFFTRYHDTITLGEFAAIEQFLIQSNVIVHYGLSLDKDAKKSLENYIIRINKVQEKFLDLESKYGQE